MKGVIYEYQCCKCHIIIYQCTFLLAMLCQIQMEERFGQLYALQTQAVIVVPLLPVESCAGPAVVLMAYSLRWERDPLPITTRKTVGSFATALVL